MGISPFAVLAASFLVFSTAERFQAAAAETAGEAPVEFTYGGIAPDKTKFVYKIKVNTKALLSPSTAIWNKMTPTKSYGASMPRWTTTVMGRKKRHSLPNNYANTLRPFPSVRFPLVKSPCKLRRLTPGKFR